MKQCIICNELKEYVEFHKNKTNKDGCDNRCKSCRKLKARENYKKDPFCTLARLKKSECKKKGLAYDLDAEYLRSLWTGVCPVTGNGITIGNSGAGSHKSGHLDRTIPELGYIRGNVAYISGRINRIKYDATLDELKLIVKYLEGATTIPKGSTLKRVEAPSP